MPDLRREVQDLIRRIERIDRHPDKVPEMVAITERYVELIRPLIDPQIKVTTCKCCGGPCVSEAELVRVIRLASASARVRDHHGAR